MPDTQGGEIADGVRRAARRTFVVTGTLLMLALIMVAERSGLPREIASLAALGLFTAALAYGAVGHRSTLEAPFAGRSEMPGGGMPAVALGVGIFSGLDSMFRASSPSLLVAQGLGCAAGFIIAFWLSRFDTRFRSIGNAFLPSALLAGTGALVLCLTLASLSLAELTHSLLALELPVWLVIAMALGCPVAAIALGGAQGAIGLATVAALMATSGFALVLGVGVLAHGAPPLPGAAEPTTLLAIAEARLRWLPADTRPPFALVMPTFEEASSPRALEIFGLSTLIAAALAHLLSNAAGIGRKGPAATAAIGAALMPLLLIAAGGYAIEAAGVAFVGASGQRPPPALVEMARLGLVDVCGARPASAEALRLACGFPVRGDSAISAEMLRFSSAFLPGGGPLALGFGSAIDLLARAAAPLLTMIFLALALAGASLGLGRDILARGRQEPGQASLRLALIRLAALLLAIVLSLTPSLGEWTDPRLLPPITAGGAALVILATFLRALARRSAAIRTA